MCKTGNKVSILKKVVTIIMILILVVSELTIHNTNNMVVLNAKSSPVVFNYGNMQDVKMGAYRIVQEYKKNNSKKFSIKVKKGNKILLNVKTQYALLRNGKLYYSKKNNIYCYNVKKEKRTVFFKLKKKVDWGGYSDIEIKTYHNSYLYYEYCMGAEDCYLARVNLKTGKKQELMGGWISEYDFFYKGYLYIYYGDLCACVNQKYYRIPLNGKAEEEIIISKCAEGTVFRYKNKLYYMQYAKKKGTDTSDTSKLTTYLKCCNLDGSNKKTLKTWKNQTTRIMRITGGVVYLQKEYEYNSKSQYELYQYNIKSKKVNATSKYPKVKKIKLQSIKGSCIVSWNRVMANWDETYEISYATNSKFQGAKVKNVDADQLVCSPKKQKAQAVTLKGLKKGKTYYVRMRAKVGYSDNYIYSPYSKTMKIKIQ